VSLIAFWRGELSVRLLWVIVRQLLRDPATALARAVDPVRSAWPPEAYVLADMYDAFTLANFKDPQPYPRPDDERREAEAVARRRSALEAQQARIRSRQAEGAR
jgi:hypothetical protein